MDWSFITTRLACGGAPDTNGVRALMRYGFTHVLDLRHTTTNTDLYWMNFVYFRNPTFDDGGDKPIDWFRASLEYTIPVLSSLRGKIYVGCHSGIHRAPSTTYAIIMALGWSPEEAAMLVLSRRPEAQLRYASDAERAVESLRLSEKVES